MSETLAVSTHVVYSVKKKWPCGGVYFVSVNTILTEWSPTAPFALGQDPKGVLAGPGTPTAPQMTPICHICGGVYFVPVLTMVTKWSPTPPFALGQDPKGVLAGPGTPRDPKSHLFVTKWVAVAPFGTWGPRPGAEFRCESRQGGPTPSISSFFVHHFGAQKWQNPNVGDIF